MLFSETLWFEQGAASAAEMQAIVTQAQVDLSDATSDIAAQAAKAGFDPLILSKATVSIREDGQGSDPTATLIVVGIAIELAAYAIVQVWELVFLPRIRRRIGSDAIGERVEKSGE